MDDFEKIDELKKRALKLNIVAIDGMTSSKERSNDLDLTLSFLEKYEPEKAEMVF